MQYVIGDDLLQLLIFSRQYTTAKALSSCADYLLYNKC